MGLGHPVNLVKQFSDEELSNPVRIFDLLGHVITHPKEYYTCLEEFKKLIAALEGQNVDKSDMCSLFVCLITEMNFYLRFTNDLSRTSQLNKMIRRSKSI